MWGAGMDLLPPCGHFQPEDGFLGYLQFRGILVACVGYDDEIPLPEDPLVQQEPDPEPASCFLVRDQYQSDVHGRLDPEVVEHLQSIEGGNEFLTVVLGPPAIHLPVPDDRFEGVGIPQGDLPDRDNIHVTHDPQAPAPVLPELPGNDVGSGNGIPGGKDLDPVHSQGFQYPHEIVRLPPLPAPVIHRSECRDPQHVHERFQDLLLDVLDR